MKNAIKSYSVPAVMVLVALALGLVSIGAFPVSANAMGGGYYYGPEYSCPNPYVYPNGYYYCPVQATPSYPPPQPQPQYPQYPTYPALSASCYANTTSVPAGTGVQWVASVSGGTGSYNYTWSGTDGLYGSSQTAYMTYYNPGTKTASVMVYSGGQSVNVGCGNTVNVYQYPVYQQPTYVQPTIVQPVIQQPPIINTNVSGLDIGCYADPGTASVNQPVTWNAEVAGGMAPYKITWSGTDGLSGESNTLIKYYQSGGSKSAIVTVTSADGRTGTRACSNSVAVRGAYVAPKPTPAPTPTPAPIQDTNLQAGALFSLGNVPWGWVAVLVILVLFATVMYLLFNRPKI